MSTAAPRPGYTKIHRDGTVLWCRPGTFETIYGPQGWTLEPPRVTAAQRAVRHVRRRSALWAGAVGAAVGAVGGHLF